MKFIIKLLSAMHFVILYRKKAKTCKSAANEGISDNHNSSSVDKNDESQKNENQSDLPMSQCRPLLLSQSGKLIPKFMAKKKIGDCVVKIERTPGHAEREYSIPVSEPEVVLKTPCFETVSVADEVTENNAPMDSLAATDIYNDNEPALVECEVESLANKQVAPSSQQFILPNNGSTEVIDSDKQGLPGDTALQVEDMGVSGEEDRENIAAKFDFLDEIQLGVNSTGTEHHEIENSTKLGSSSVGSSVGNSKVTAHTPLRETVNITLGDCTQSEDLETAGNDNNPCQVEVGETKIDNNNEADGADDVQSEVNAENSSNRISSDVVMETSVEIAPVPETAPCEVKPSPDVASADDDRDRKLLNDGTENSVSNVDVGSQLDASELDAPTGASEEMHESKTRAADHCDPAPVVSASAEANGGSETAGDMDIHTESDNRQFIPGPSDPPLFDDDFLDLTDSQLCQLDDMSRSVA